MAERFKFVDYNNNNENKWLRNFFNVTPYTTCIAAIAVVVKFAVGQFAVRKKNPNLIWTNLTETNIFSYGEMSHGEMSYGQKSAHE